MSVAPPPSQRPWGLLAAAGGSILALGALALVLLGGSKEPVTYTLQVTNPLAKVVAVTCASGPMEDGQITGVELGPDARADLALVGLPAKCTGVTVDGAE